MPMTKKKKESTFSLRLNQLMRENKLSERALGAELFLSPTAIGYYKNGRTEPSIETIHRMCRRFNVSSDWLLGISDIRRTL